MMFVAFAHRYCFGSDEYTVEDNDSDIIIEDAACGDVIAGPANVPPIRLSVWENLMYTLKHEDILSDVRDIVRNR
ncbi:hypothetical protein ADEAN_000073800 [Angomonas deanei]|uniref:Uncharacterized protein n=1 Tax=Angomonas deanei TaxID=59799 RepID=A0A7G2C3K3_9TRYP|nr:hypothetical protein ADEAN_000073800 [Angomonas deanei]